jgi:PAS domain S-box-containing protein
MDSDSKTWLPTEFRASFLRRSVASLVLFNLTLIALTVTTLKRNYSRSELEARNASRNICQVLDQSLSSSVREIELGVLAIRDEYERQLNFGQIDAKTMNAFIDRQFNYLSNVYALRIADSNGIILYGIGVNPKDKVMVQDRDYFVRLRDDHEAKLVFSKPLLGRISHQWAVIFGRRINDSNGNFAGVVYATLLLEAISKRFSTIDLGKKGSISLRNEKLELVARFPTFGTPAEIIEQKQASSELERELVTGRTEGTLFLTDGMDNVPRIVTYRKLNGYPFYIIVGISREEYLKGWRSEVTRASGLVLLSIIATTLFGVLIYRARKREQDAVVNLAKEQEKYRIVANNTLDWEFWIAPDGSVIYSSPSCYESTGHTASEIYADPDLMLRIVHPDDKANYERHRKEVTVDNARKSNFVYRITHADGSIRWLEQACRSVVDDTGQFMGFRGSNREITARKLAEQAKEEALDRVRSLEGIIPICMYCKKIRDSENSWNQLEKYITEHSEAVFSHGICPRCVEEHRADLE